MPPPDRVLALLKKATAAVAATPGRHGHLIQPPHCTEVVVAGDLHGHVPNFQAVLKHADLAAHPGRHLILQEVVHSSFRYPAGGDRSHQLLDLFAALKCQFPERVHLLPGNHELAQWTNRSVGKGDESQNAAFRQGVDVAYGSAGGEIYAAYMQLLPTLPLAVRTANGVFISHSLPNAKHLPGCDLTKFTQETYTPEEYAPGGFVYGVVWGRDTSPATVAAYLRKVDCDLLVSGHIPTDAGYAVPNPQQLIVDCAESPAACVRFPTDRPLTQADLLAGVVVW